MLCVGDPRSGLSESLSSNASKLPVDELKNELDEKWNVAKPLDLGRSENNEEEKEKKLENDTVLSGKI